MADFRIDDQGPSNSSAIHALERLAARGKRFGAALYGTETRPPYKS
jgi:hypothetical protein